MITNKLIELRKEKGLNQEQLAKILNMSKTGYAGWEQGRTEPNIAAIKKLCAFYEITADELLEMDK